MRKKENLLYPENMYAHLMPYFFGVTRKLSEEQEKAFWLVHDRCFPEQVQTFCRMYFDDGVSAKEILEQLPELRAGSSPLQKAKSICLRYLSIIQDGMAEVKEIGLLLPLEERRKLPIDVILSREIRRDGGFQGILKRLRADGFYDLSEVLNPKNKMKLAHCLNKNDILVMARGLLLFEIAEFDDGTPLLSLVDIRSKVQFEKRFRESIARFKGDGGTLEELAELYNGIQSAPNHRSKEA